MLLVVWSFIVQCCAQFIYENVFTNKFSFQYIDVVEARYFARLFALCIASFNFIQFAYKFNLINGRRSVLVMLPLL